MEDKRFPGSDNYGQNNEDEYSPLEETAEEIDDDDLDLSELLKKYMPETAEKSDGSDETAAEAFGSGADSEEALAESVDASEYGEFASEIYSDEDARRAAQADKAAYGEFGSDVADNDGGYADYAPDEASPSVDDVIGEAYGEAPVDEILASQEPVEDYVEADTARNDEALQPEEAVPEDIDFADPAAYDGAQAYYPQDNENGYADASGEEFPEGAELEDYADEIEYTGEQDASGEVGEEYPDYGGEYGEAYADADGDGYDADNVEYDADTAEYDENTADSEETEENASDFVNYEEQEEELDIDENIDSDDINLMIAFGLDEDLERTMGFEVAQKLTGELDEEQRKRDEKVRKTVDNEYMNRAQTAGFAKEYKSKYRFVKIRLALSALFAVILFFYENLRLFGYEFDGALDGTVYPTVYIMVSLQIMLLCAACALPELMEGIKNLFTGKIGPCSVTSLLVLAAIAHSVVQTQTVRIAQSPTLINFTVALTVVFTLVSEYFNIRREIFAFNVVSSKRPKHIVTKVQPVYGEETDPDGGDLLKFESASFIDNFFTRTKEPTHASKTYASAAIIIALVSALIAGFFSKFTGSEVPVCVDNAFTAFFIAVPMSMLIATSYPFYRASRDAYDNDGAIIGECSLEDYSDASCVTFDDVGVFPSYGVRVQNVKIYNNHRIDRVLYYASSAFSVARGPLTDVFEVATIEIGHSDNVKIKAAGSGYLAVTVDEKNITFGSAAELVSRGFWIPESITDEDEYNENDVSVMYMFREEKLMAKMLIKYTLDSDFESIMSSLCDEGISVSIKTYDPNIDDDLIGSGLLRRSEYSYSVTRYDGADDGNCIKDNADSGIVSRGSAKTLLQMLSDCAKVLASRRAGITIGIISAVVSALLMLIVILSGRGDSMNSAVIAVYQLFWMIPTMICAHMYVR